MMKEPTGELTKKAQWIYDIAISDYHMDNRIFFSADYQNDFKKEWGMKYEKITSVFEELKEKKSIVDYKLIVVNDNEPYIVYVEYMIGY